MNEKEEYALWVEDNKERLIDDYAQTEPDAPEGIYEGILDDEYPETYERWLQSLTIEDVPDDYIWARYESAMDYDPAEEYDRMRDMEADDERD